MPAWNNFDTGSYDSMICEPIAYEGHNGDEINAYYARPMGAGPFPGIVLVHHLPGWDELYREFARRFAQHGYVTICPNLYARSGQGSPDDLAAKARGEGGVSDEQVAGDLAAAAQFVRAQPYSSGKLGIIGTCSGGRHSYMTAAKTQAFDAVGDLWGGRVVMAPDQLNANTPVAPIDMTKDINCPVLGLFGNDDQAPSPAEVDQLEAALKQYGKDYEFHRYDGAGHAFFYYDRPAYRQEQARDGWEKVFDFFERNLTSYPGLSPQREEGGGSPPSSLF
jgi:carboxymethylenebutenolidase